MSKFKVKSGSEEGLLGEATKLKLQFQQEAAFVDGVFNALELAGRVALVQGVLAAAGQVVPAQAQPVQQAPQVQAQAEADEVDTCCCFSFFK